MFHTPLCDLLNIKYPIIQGGMAWVSHSSLVAAVSNAGGLGMIAAGSLPNDILQEEIQKTKTLTDKPFGVNIVPLAGVSLKERASLLAREGVSIVSTAFSDPTEPIIDMLHRYDITVLSVVPTVRLAKRVEIEGADIIVASGCEGGGHVGTVGTLPLVPAVVDAVSKPVVAAGGIGDGRGLLASLCLGACGIQMGTRFIACKEGHCHENYKQSVCNMSEEDTVVTGKFTGTTVRTLHNEFTRKWLRHEELGEMTKEEYQSMGVGMLARVVETGDIDNATAAVGQIGGIISDVKSAQEIIDDIITTARDILQKQQVLLSSEPFNRGVGRYS
ncbi:MAG: nitronate monooxygenase [Deltaproteobacteria bacterium]|nr:nitronate monooxygenase [Deltaproteobacteria bacterium]MBW2075349.1 nitronate monooxygenase [Deltaproteobacteria bacterium]